MSLAYIAVIVIAAFLIAFICAYIHYYFKAKKREQTHGEPVNHGKILSESLAVGAGLACICCAAATKAEAKADAGADWGGGGVEAQQPGPVPDMSIPQQPMPSFQPNVNWTPVQSTAQDGVQR